MEQVNAGERIWEPSPEFKAKANLTQYMNWLDAERGLRFTTYAELWRWSVENIEEFWSSLFSYFELTYSQPWTTPLEARRMPGARWFPGAKLNYIENILARQTPGQPALIYKAEDSPLQEMSWGEL
ncbi:MAG: acetyl-coenzyme A synthetase N-terminal domain-containing protein, partial [Candidatus Promineifilaceae bacterium]|nr:acetyl-coenzyme A synthetase N-terminal domain-containing protein [Candidatus Promineifilaceae bacterium]